MKNIKVENKEIIFMFVKVVLTIATIIVSAYVAVLSVMILFSAGIHPVIAYIAIVVLPSLLLPLIWLKKRKKFLIRWLIAAVIYFIALGANYAVEKYDKSITINTSPNINIHEYLPFEENSKIVKKDSETLKLTENLPKIDGAAALFPVYSAFVNEVYPATTQIYAVTYEENTNENVDKLLEWILSEEGQYIIEETGYVGIMSNDLE